MKRILVTIIFTIVFANNIFNLYAENKTFSTWDSFEVDKLASIWLIKRFIAPDASIVIYPKGEVIKDGLQFDTPFSSISRKFNKSTFESLLEHYKIKDKKLSKICKLIHDIEINVWEKKVFQMSSEIKISIMEITDNGKDNEGIIEKSNKYFEQLYNNMTSELELLRK